MLARFLLAVALMAALFDPAYCQSRTEIYDLQERCGKRAMEMFEKDYPPAERKGLELFENHYNVKLNRCFMIEENTTFTRHEGKTLSIKTITLIDVNDNKIVGEFSPAGCEVRERKCRSEQEFRALIKPLMEE